jgi:hypothetical protein
LKGTGWKTNKPAQGRKKTPKREQTKQNGLQLKKLKGGQKKKTRE